jgi:hypothetical protein
MKMSLPRGQPLSDKRAVAAEVDKLHVQPLADDDVAITALER